jgi:HlyD family secretion protein
MKKWTKRGLMAMGTVAVLGLVASAVVRGKTQQAAEPKFKMAQADLGNVTQAILASGTLQPVTSVSVGVQVSGTVLERSADFNDHVKANQVLLKLDPATFHARIRQAQAQVNSARASVALAQSNDERNMRLVNQGFLSHETRDNSKREAAIALANVEVAQAQLDAARTDLNNSIVRAPISGVIIKRNIDVGQTVAASFQTPDLFQIAQDLKKMLIYTNVSEADVGLIKPGQQVRFGVDAYPGREFTGAVQQFRLNATNAAGVVTYNVVIGVDNSDELLKPGMTANTRIVISSRNNVLRVPTAALRFKPEQDDLPTAAPKADASPAEKADPNDDGVTRRRAGTKVYRLYTAGTTDASRKQAISHDVTIGIGNSRFTEITSTDIKPGTELIVGSLAAASAGKN